MAFGQGGFINGGGSVTASCTGFIRNCTFQGVGTGSVVFIQLARAPLIEFSNNILRQTVFTTSQYGVSYYGLDFDGTIRTIFGDTRGYTVIDAGAADAAVSTVWNMHSDFTMRGTNYAQVANDLGTANAHVEFVGRSTGGGNNLRYTAYLNNFRVETPLVAIRWAETDFTPRDMDLYITYSWSPIFNDLVDGTEVTDVTVLGVPADTLTYPGNSDRPRHQT